MSSLCDARGKLVENRVRFLPPTWPQCHIQRKSHDENTSSFSMLVDLDMRSNKHVRKCYVVKDGR